MTDKFDQLQQLGRARQGESRINQYQKQEKQMQRDLKKKQQQYDEDQEFVENDISCSDDQDEVDNLTDKKQNNIQDYFKQSNQQNQNKDNKKSTAIFDQIFKNDNNQDYNIDQQNTNEEVPENIKTAFMNKEEQYKQQYDQKIIQEDDSISMNVLNLLNIGQKDKQTQQDQQPQQTSFGVQNNLGAFKTQQNTVQKPQFQSFTPNQPNQYSNQQYTNKNNNTINTGIQSTFNTQNILNEDQTIDFFLLDLYEDFNLKNQIILVGKVLNQVTKQYESCTIILQNLFRNIYFVPTESTLENKQYRQLKDEADQKAQKFMEKQKDFKCHSYMCQRSYAFELDIQKGKNNYLKMKYSFQYPTLPSDTFGKYFQCLVGTTYSAIELFLLKKQISGPQWIKIQKGYEFTKNIQSYTKYEIKLSNYKNMDIIENQQTLTIPPLKIMSVSVKKFMKTKQKQEVVQLSIATYQTDINNNSFDDKQVQFQSFVRPIQHALPQVPPGTKQVNNEMALYSIFIAKICEYDPDVFLSHDLYQNTFDAIFNGVKDNSKLQWQKFGRINNINRSKIPQGKLQQKIRDLTKGRLLVDTFQMAKELVKDLDYSLTSLSQGQLNISRKEFDIEQTEKVISSKGGLQELIIHTQKDCNLQIQLMLKLQILPLTKELTNICGNIWNHSLQNRRAERNEMLLMHSFYCNKYILPDKFYQGYDESAEQQPRNHKAKYKGGFVLDPVPGLYENYIILLDFNSLYPSIIQEFNICFTTIVRSSLSIQEYTKKAKIKKSDDKQQDEEDEIGQVPENIDHSKLAILPIVIQNLVSKRKEVKLQMQRETNQEKKQVLDIKQLAFKLVANSMYGCLGFGSSRFYAQPIASLITYQGRRILKDSIEIVKSLGFNVVYGDTDSLMINPNQTKLGDALKVGKTIKEAVSKKYKKLIFDIDGVFKSLLLLRKKKYAAQVLKNLSQLLGDFNSTPKWDLEIKGLDMIRRDWCDLSRNSGKDVLKIIIENDGKDHDIMVQKLYDYMSILNNKLKSMSIREFLITKQLTKNPLNYPDGKNQPHVKIALEQVENGTAPESLIGKTIGYVICKQQEGTKDSISERATHPNKVKNGSIDYDYYKKQQILQPILRMTDVIEQINRQRLADCLELDKKEYQQNENNYRIENQEEENYAYFQDVQPLRFKFKGKDVKFKGVYTDNISKNSIFTIIPDGIVDQLEIIGEACLENKILTIIRQLIKQYYKNFQRCQDCEQEDNQIRVNINKCCNIQCNENYTRVLTSKQIYEQINQIKDLFDYQKEQKVKNEIKKIEKQYCEYMLEKINNITNKSEYGIIKIGKLFRSLGISC